MSKDIHAEMMDACAATGQLTTVHALLHAADADEDAHGHTGPLRWSHLLAAWQDLTTGCSPLMLAAQHGHLAICAALLEAGAPWNAVDRYGQCAGNYATDNEQWEAVNLLVEAGTKAEVRSACCCLLCSLYLYIYIFIYI